MINYFLESSICFAAFYELYWLVLSKTKLLNLNRIYLLVTALFSVVVPLIDISVSSEVIGFFNSGEQSTAEIASYAAGNPSGYFIDPWLMIYLLGFLACFALLSRSVLRLVKLLGMPKKKRRGYWHVQTSEQQISSFLNFIFLPADYNAKDKAAQISLAHEEAHLKQFHSIDLICLELLQVLFWFNPFVYAYKRALKLQHEYIADHLVVQTSGKSVYSQTLIRHTLQGVNFALIHSYAAHPVEKRIEMIEKQNPTTMKKLKPLFALPLIICLLFTFGLSSPLQAQETVEQAKEKLLAAKSSTPSVPKSLKGKVQTGSTGAALDKVIVIAMPSRKETLTNKDGDYLIEPAATDTLLIFRKKGFDDIRVPRKQFSVVNVALPEKGLARKKGN